MKNTAGGALISSKSNLKASPQPLFDTLANLNSPALPCINTYLQKTAIATAPTEYKLTLKFLENYSGSQDTFTAYRREIERFLHWTWLIAHKELKAVDRNDVRQYVTFCQNPPLTWIATQNVARFVMRAGERIPNPEWRPFVARISKAQHKEGNTPDQHNYVLSNKSLAALFAILSTFFTFLQQENYLETNPVQLVRQKSQIIQKQQTHHITRKLSNLQWQYTIETIETLARTNPEYERHLFLLTLFYLLGLRISEIAATTRRTPTMASFSPDKEGRWWFTTVGKGNKLRDIAVPDIMLLALKRYRTHLNFSVLPTRGENTPLIASRRGHGRSANLGSRQIRNLVQECFDLAIERLKQDNKTDEAQDLAAATVHWLRHTAISADVAHRPREHVRDDAGHESAVITDHYIDIDRAARHDSARSKQLKPFVDEKNETS